MKQWEQIIFAVMLAALGWVLFNTNNNLTKQGAPALGAIPPGKTPLFYSLSQINTKPGNVPDAAAANVSIASNNFGLAGANNYLPPENNLFPYLDSYGD